MAVEIPFSSFTAVMLHQGENMGFDHISVYQTGQNNPSRRWRLTNIMQDTIDSCLFLWTSQGRLLWSTWTKQFPKMASIEEFFADKVVFITGGTGFLGKVLLEKLLRSCSRVQKIYLLIRSRPDATPQQRIDSIMQTKVSHLFSNNLVVMFSFS